MRKTLRHSRRKLIAEILEPRQLLSTYHVDANAPGSTQDGASWETAFKDLQTLLTSPTLLSGDTVKVADGTYKPTATTDQTVSFNLINGVGIFGGYAGYGAIDPEARNTSLYPTILSGDIGSVGTSADNSYQIVTANASSPSTILDGLTLANGNANGVSPNDSGGGIYNVGGSPTINNCSFLNNLANFAGAGIFNSASAAPTITNCLFTGNYANPGLTTHTGGGGGIYNTASNPSILNCKFLNNKAGAGGGGIANIAGSNAIITNCLFVNNTQASWGGAIRSQLSDPIVTNSVFIANTALYFGGAIDCDGASPTFTNCTFYGNTASRNGGVINISTVSGPTADPTMTNCILWNNAPTSNPTIIDGSMTYCDIQGGYVGAGNSDVDPLFVRNPSAGSDGTWGTADDDYGDLQLQPASRCINAGLNAANPSAADLAGNLRIQNDVIDLGAYESPYSPVTRFKYVDPNAHGDNSGSSWDNAFTNLQSALSASIDGDTIKVAQGTYKPTTNNDRTLSFTLNNGVAILGGFAGIGAPDPDARDTKLYPTLLSGDIGTVGINSDNSYHVVRATSVNSFTLLDGVTITLGNANGIANDVYGGGFLNLTKSSPTLTHCIFVGNSASSVGGAIYNGSSSPTLINCLFVGNSSSNYGEIYNSNSSPSLINCTLVGNSPYSGFGIFNASSSPKLTNCIIWNNGNAPIYYSSSDPTISYNDIESGYSENGNISVNPQFVRSPWSGPDGVWGTPDDDYGDLRLRSTSPCLNAGSNAVNSSFIDLAGNPRIQNDVIDIGVYEGSVTLTPKTLYVDPNALGDNSGSSWDNAFTTLQSAISAAIDGDTIKVAQGTYKPTTTTNRTLSFNLRCGVAILGSYAGTGAPDPDARDTKLYPTLLSGDIGTVGTNSDNSYHVVTAAGVSSLTVLDGVTITLGNANGSDANQNYGGGFLTLPYSSPILTHCMFVGNSASSGGAIYNRYSSPILINCLFVGNSAPNGGGIYNYNASTSLINCSLVGNNASSGASIYNADSSSILTNCILWNNGNAPIYYSSSAPTLSYSDIEGGFTGTGNLSVNPQFVRTPWTGPDCVWGTPDDDYGDLRLRSASPCLNAGSNAVNSTLFDFAGNPRIQNNVIDIGAYEGSVTITPKTLYVDPNALGDNSGSSWDNAFTNLQSALSAAFDGDTIKIADGTYKPTTTTNRTVSFLLKNRLGIYGGYAGAGAPNPDARDTTLYPTILSGEIGIERSNSDNSYNVVVCKYLDGPVTLDGLTITRGHANNSAAEQTYHGGGIFIYQCSPSISNCVFTENFASYGGAISAILSNPTISNCLFSGNSALYNGGAFDCYNNSQPNLINCTFTGNSAGNGGAIDVNNAVITLSQCVLTKNSASTNGGGIYLCLSNSSLTHCAISRNSAKNGGGVYNDISSPTLTNCSIIANAASSSGGAIYNSSNNSSDYSSPVITNCSIIANSASYGGGLHIASYSSPKLINCTLTSNSAKTSGGGIYNFIYASPILTNCILWNNGVSIFNSNNTSTPTITYSDIEGSYAGVGNLNIDPKFVRKPAIGADGIWGTADDDYGDLHLLDSSSCINAGLNSANATTTDLAGDSRVLNIVIDMGAYENRYAIQTYYVDPNAVGNSDGLSWENAFTTLQAALFGVSIGDTIKIADGTYKPTTSTDRTISFVLRLGIAIYGGYAGYGAPNPDARDITLYPTILSGDIGTIGTKTDNSYHVVTAYNVASSTILDGVTITLGYANGTGTNQNQGGGMLNLSLASPTLTNCTFSLNTASGGGGIYNASSSPILTNCVFSGNSASSYGGGIFNTASSSPSLSNCTFSGNTASTSGGGIYNTSSSTPTLFNCSFARNSATTAEVYTTPLLRPP